VDVDHGGNVIRDTRTTSMRVLPPILPFVGVGLDRTLRRGARLRVEADAGPYVVRATIGLSVLVRRTP
jgi:hypothetical protein